MSEDEGKPHRLDGFDPDIALDEIRDLCRTGSYTGTRIAELFSLLDHWLILGLDPPAEWRWPEPGVVAERVMSNQPKRTTRAQRRR